MESKKAQSCLRTFLEVSQIQIDERNKRIRRKESFKSILDSSKKTEVNKEISLLVQERNQIQGRLDCVRLEMLDMILDNPSLVSSKLLAKKGCKDVVSFVKQEKETIELRGVYQYYPCSINEVLNIGLSVSSKDYVSFSFFDKPQTEATKKDIEVAVDEKNIKIMTKSL